MNKFDLILRNIVFFLWPIPFLLGFAIEYHHWTASVAYAAIAVLVLAAVWRLVTVVWRLAGRRSR
jgi:ABC-type uncharacterized transport system permease subunit